MANVKAVVTLLANVAVTGAAILINQGGTYSFAVLGTFGGATVSLQILGPDGATYITVPNSGMTAAGVVTADIPTGATVKALVAGGAPANLYASLSLIR